MWQGCLHFQGTKWRQVISLTKISCWRIERCVLRNCLASTCSLQRAWTEPPVPLWLKDLPRGLSGCKMKMDLWVFICQLQKQLLYCTNVWDLLRDSLHWNWSAIQTQLPNLPSDSCPTSGRPNTLLSICWCLDPVPSYLSVRLSNYHLAEAIACWGVHHI